MNQTTELNELDLQRCVDGELSEAQQQHLLCQLEQHPSGWRTLALAFIEHQLWAQAGREWVTRPTPPPAEAAPAVARFGGWLRPTAIAASTMLAVGLGYLGGNFDRGAGPGTNSGIGREVAEVVPVPTIPMQPVSVVTVPQESARDSREPAMMVDWIPEGGGPPVRMPVYDAETVKRHGEALLPRLSEASRRELEALGIQISEEPVFLNLPGETNRKLVIPVNNIHLRQRMQ